MPNPTTANEAQPMTIPEPHVYSIKCNHCHENIFSFYGGTVFDLAKLVQDHEIKANCRPHYGRVSDAIFNLPPPPVKGKDKAIK